MMAWARGATPLAATMGLALTALFSSLSRHVATAHHIPARLSRPLYAPETPGALRRATSQDASCPAGFLCVQEPCPSSALCATGEVCVNFEGTLACVPDGSSWCALNPSSFEGVGCWDGTCCHGQCYVDNVVCCDNPATQCSLGTACNVCSRGQQCANGGCSTPPTTTASSSQSSSVPASSAPLSTTSVVSTSNPSSTPSKTIPATGSVPPATTTAPAVSSSSTLPPSPTTVASIDPFQSPACIQDSTTARVLVNGSSSDTSSTGMTVEECINLAQGWQYAGVEYGGECWWGDNPVNPQTASPGDCNMPCAGNPEELCGAGNRMIIYRDTTWVIPTRPELGAQVQEYLDLLSQLQQAIQQWNELIQEAIAQQGSGSGSSKVRRQVPADILTEIATARAAIISLQARWTQLTATISRHFKTGDNYAILEEIEMQELTQVYPPVDEQLVAIASDAAVVANSGLTVVATVAQNALTVLGRPRVVQGGGVVVAATGIFAIGFDLLDSLLGDGSGTSPSASATVAPTVPPLSTPPPTITPTSTMASSTSSTSCTYTEGPTPIIIVTTNGTTAEQFKELVDSLPVDEGSESMTQSYLPNWVYIGKMDRCTAESLWDNPIVEAMSINRFVVTFEGNDVDPDTLNLTNPTSDTTFAPKFDPSAHTVTYPSTTAQRRQHQGPLSERTLAADKRYVYQNQSGGHLRWISGQSRQKANTGQFYDFEDYLYDDRSLMPDPLGPLRIYIIDTSFLSTHVDFSSRIRSVTAVIGGIGDYDSSHGTCMVSVAAGTWTGVYKDADIALVQTKFNQFADSVAIETIVKAFGYIAAEVAALSLEGNAVISMSFGVPKRIEWFDDADNPGQRIRTDAIGAMLRGMTRIGVAQACSAGNWEGLNDDYSTLNAQSPRINGGTDSPLVVVGNADDTGNRYPTSNYRDPDNAGILTIYGPGTNVLCAVKDNTNAWGSEGNGTSQATAATAGLMAYFLSDPSLRAQFVEGGVQNMPLRLKQYLIQVATAQKGIGGWGDANTDSVPRLANGENVECSGGTVTQSAPPVPPFVTPTATTGLTLFARPVSNGLDVVLAEEYRPGCYNRP